MKLVVTDLDGTLLSPEREISDEAVEVIRQWKEAGGLFSFITGRPAPGVLGYMTRAGVNAPMVCCNGAEVVEAAEDGFRILHREQMGLKGLRTLMEKADEAGFTVLYYRDGEEYAMRLTKWVSERRKRGRRYPVEERGERFWEETQAQKVNVMADKGPGAEAIRPLMEQLASDYEVVIYERYGCEITPKGGGKAQGLKRLAGILGIPMKEIMAVGDNANDLEMLRVSGLGAAVGNGTSEAKACADYVCEHANTDGVVEAIRRFCLSGPGTEEG